MAAHTLLDPAELVERILQEYAAIPYANSSQQKQTVFDREHRRFLLVSHGWDNGYRIHRVILDVEVKGDKFWIHQDSTEDGIATDLELAGIPKDRIVLAWIQEDDRKYTEYAVR
ncbi:MAG: XisI protein [Meiothermus sp.]|nr:XisI protein [Meiothermus sp.]